MNTAEKSLGQGQGEGAPRHIVFLVFPGLVLLDLAGPWDVFENANVVVVSQGKKPAYELALVAAGETKEVSVQGGLAVLARYSGGKYPHQIDTLVACGSRGMHQITPEQMRTPEIKRLFNKSRRVASICVGAFQLAAAGLLDGRRATTHWLSCERLASLYPNVEVELDPLFVKDGSVYTSAGVTAGIDLSLALVEEDLGRDIALQVARRLVVSTRRLGGQAQYSPASQVASSEQKLWSELMDWAEENPAGDLSVEALAKRVGMSERNFARVFRRDVGQTPGEFVDRLRVDLAREQLEKSDASLDEIAVAVGLGSADSMRRVFLRLVKVAPGAYRSRFRS